MEWLTLSLIATALWAAANTIDKVVLSEFSKKPVFCVAIAGILGLVFAIVEALSIRIQIVDTLPLFLSLLQGIIYIGAILFYFRALSVEEVTRIIPIMQIIPLITLFLSTIFLNEIFNLFQYTGIAFIIGGAFLVSLKKNANNILTINSGFRFISISCLLFSISWVLSKYILDDITYYNFFFWSRLGGFLAISAILISSYKMINLKIMEINKISFALLAFSEILNLIGLFLITIVLSQEPASIISTIMSSQPIFVLAYAFILSYYLPKTFKLEVQRATIMAKIIASALIILGFLLIKGA